jgi:hypothetical protein
MWRYSSQLLVLPCLDGCPASGHTSLSGVVASLVGKARQPMIALIALSNSSLSCTRCSYPHKKNVSKLLISFTRASVKIFFFFFFFFALFTKELLYTLNGRVGCSQIKNQINITIKKKNNKHCEEWRVYDIIYSFILYLHFNKLWIKYCYHYLSYLIA